MINQPFYTGMGMPANANVQPANWNQPTMYPTMGQPQMQAQNPQPMANPSFNTPPRSYMQGRIVNAEEEIRPNEVPGDGSIAVFPFMDRSKILVKEVTGNGTIASSVYVLQQDVPAQEESVQNDIMAPVLERLDNIEKMIKRNSRYRKKPQAKEGEE